MWSPDWDYSDGFRSRDTVRLPVTYSGMILVTCVVLFIFDQIAPDDLALNYLALNPTLVEARPWTLITHMFLHASFDHLLWNMIFLFFFGTELERRAGERRFLEIYLLSGLVAAFGQLLYYSFTGAGADTFMLGASGALYGVLGCLAIIAPEIRVLLFFVIPLRIQYAVILFAIMDFTMMGSGDNIAHMAHLTGLLVGLAFGYSMKGRYRYLA